MSNKSIETIKKELHFIKSKQIAINTYLEAEAQYLKRLDWLKSQKQSQSIQKDIMRTEQVLNSLKAEINITKLQKLEEFYLGIINQLEDEIDRVILIKFYIQGKTRERIARETHYSLGGIKSRLTNAIIKLKRKMQTS